MQDWPEDLFEFAWFPNRPHQLRELANLAEPEEWEYQYTATEFELPILFNYLRYTYRQLAREEKIYLSINGTHACFNTGLVTPHQEPIFAKFTVNRWEDALQQWYFVGWFRRGHRELTVFSDLPDIAQYIDDPSALILDTRKPFRENIEHIIIDSRERFPEPFRSKSDFELRNLLAGAISSAKARTRRNYKTAIPQYHKGRIPIATPAVSK